MNFQIIFFATVALSHAAPDIGLKLREEARKLARDGDEQAEAQSVVYGNGIEGKDAEIVESEFDIDEDGNYKYR